MLRHRSENDESGSARSDPLHDVPPFVPSIDTKDVFRQLIAEELRHGRLTPARRRRIVRYAAHLQLSPVEVGRMISACREEALASAVPAERGHALRLVEPEPERLPLALKMAAVVLLALLFDLLLFGLLS